TPHTSQKVGAFLSLLTTTPIGLLQTTCSLVSACLHSGSPPTCGIVLTSFMGSRQSGHSGGTGASDKRVRCLKRGDFDPNQSGTLTTAMLAWVDTTRHRAPEGRPL